METLYFDLFVTFFYIGLFGFGGGYSMLSMIQYEVVEARGWMSIGEFTDIVAISQMTPGPVSINCATYVGYTATGGHVGGACVATLAVCLPSVLLMTLISCFVMKLKNNPYLEAALQWMQPTAIGLIAAAALLLMNASNFIDYKSYGLAIGAFVLTYCFKFGIIRVIILAGLVGYLLY